MLALTVFFTKCSSSVKENHSHLHLHNNIYTDFLKKANCFTTWPCAPITALPTVKSHTFIVCRGLERLWTEGLSTDLQKSSSCSKRHPFIFLFVKKSGVIFQSLSLFVCLFVCLFFHFSQRGVCHERFGGHCSWTETKLRWAVTKIRAPLSYCSQGTHMPADSHHFV